jgi:hypothetical protein
VIRDLAASEAALVDEASDLAADVEAYRELAHEALHKLADLTTQLARANETNRRLRDELRRYTASVVLGQAA